MSSRWKSIPWEIPWDPVISSCVGVFMCAFIGLSSGVPFPRDSYESPWDVTRRHPLSSSRKIPRPCLSIIRTWCVNCLVCPWRRCQQLGFPGGNPDTEHSLEWNGRRASPLGPCQSASWPNANGPISSLRISAPTPLRTIGSKLVSG